MIVMIKFSSCELTTSELMKLGRVISEMYQMNGYPLPLADDPLRGHQVELIMTPKKTLLAP